MSSAQTGQKPVDIGWSNWTRDFEVFGTLAGITVVGGGVLYAGAMGGSALLSFTSGWGTLGWAGLRSAWNWGARYFYSAASSFLFRTRIGQWAFGTSAAMTGGNAFVGGGGVTQQHAANQRLVETLYRRYLSRVAARFKGRGLKIIVDENLSPKIAEQLRAKGINAIHVRDLVPAGTKDPRILDIARAIGAKVLTVDKGSQGPGRGGFYDGITNFGVLIPDKIARSFKDIIRLVGDQLR